MLIIGMEAVETPDRECYTLPLHTRQSIPSLIILSYIIHISVNGVNSVIMIVSFNQILAKTVTFQTSRE